MMVMRRHWTRVRARRRSIIVEWSGEVSDVLMLRLYDRIRIWMGVSIASLLIDPFFPSFSYPLPNNLAPPFCSTNTSTFTARSNLTTCSPPSNSPTVTINPSCLNPTTFV